MKWVKVKIDNHKTDYIISERGDVINVKTGNMKRPYLYDGFMRMSFKIGKKNTTRSIAKVMLESFYNKIQKDDEILHFKDSDVTNLNLNNIDFISIDEYIEILTERRFIKCGNNTYKLIFRDYDDEIYSKIIIEYKYSKYLVSNYGRIFNLVSGKYLNPTIPTNKDIYPFITIRMSGKNYRLDIHCLVATYFVHNPNPRIFNIVHHKDHDKRNFNYKNLEWTDTRNNILYAKENNRILYGENAKQSKITEKTARKICEMLSEGNRVCEIVNTLGVSKNIVRHIKDGDSWSHISSQYNISNYKNNRLTANDIDVIINLLKQNKTYEEIRKLTGCSKSSIYYIKDNYYKTRTKKTIRSKTRIDAMIFKLYNENVSIDDISELTGHTKKYILDTITHFKS